MKKNTEQANTNKMYRKRTKKQQLRSEADKLWFLKYLKNCCEVCGTKGILQAHHFFYRSSYGHLRYLPENHITLCHACHFLLHHQDPKAIEDQITAKRGLKWLIELKEMAYKRPPGSYLTLQYYYDRIKELQDYETNDRKTNRTCKGNG